jgi:hypothetical protein
VPVDLDAAARVAERVGEVLIEEALELIELNPVLVSPEGAVAVDATMRRRVPLPTPAPSTPSTARTPPPLSSTPIPAPPSSTPSPAPAGIAPCTT